MDSFDMSFYKGKRVLITGHTGFKGSWMCRMLINAGAKITGYALEAEKDVDDGFDGTKIIDQGKSLFEISDVSSHMTSVTGDIRDLSHMMQVFDECRPEIVIHMAAQPIVRTSYEQPVYTYETNVMGTVNILECVRTHDCVRSFVNVTTDKVYHNREWSWGYRENEELCGFDPYSNSKSCSELVTYSYDNSFLKAAGVAVSTARAGNVIGGGDFAKDRIIPDCIRAVCSGNEIAIRNPYSTRPFQFVLEPVYCYLMIAAMQFEDISYAGNYNVGPDECDCLTTGELADLFCRKWNSAGLTAMDAAWKNIGNNGPHEASFLKLDCSRMKTVFRWQPRWHIDDAMDRIIEWTGARLGGNDIVACMDRQIADFLRKDDNG